MERYEDRYQWRVVTPSLRAARVCFIEGIKADLRQRAAYTREFRAQLKNVQRNYRSRYAEIQAEWLALPEPRPDCCMFHDQANRARWVECPALQMEYFHQFRQKTRFVHLGYGLLRGRKYEELERGKLYAENTLQARARLHRVVLGIYTELKHLADGLGRKKNLVPPRHTIKTWLLEPARRERPLTLLEKKALAAARISA